MILLACGKCRNRFAVPDSAKDGEFYSCAVCGYVGKAELPIETEIERAVREAVEGVQPLTSAKNPAIPTLEFDYSDVAFLHDYRIAATLGVQDVS